MATSRPATALKYRDGSLGIQLMRGAVNLLLLLVSISLRSSYAKLRHVYCFATVSSFSHVTSQRLAMME